MIKDNKIIGIDVGVSGAISFISKDYNDVFPIPTIITETKTKKSKKIDANKLYLLLKNLIKEDLNTIVIIENVHSMPGQGVCSVFSFGRSLGVIEGILSSLLLNPIFVTPQAWKAKFPELHSLERKDAKNKAREIASILYPKHTKLFSKKKNDGLAEAMLIAHSVLL